LLAGEEKALSKLASQMGRDTLSVGSEYGRRALESASQVDAHFQSRPSTEEDVLRKAASIVARFGIHSIGIDGDAVLSPPDMMKRLLTAEKDLEAACVKLGLEDEAFGTKRKLRVLVSNETSFHTSIQGAGGMFSPYASEPDQCEDAVLAYCQGSQAVERISHEFGHNVDFRLCKLALGESYGDDEHDFFSELPSRLQARLPRAKAALENIFRLLEDNVDTVDRTAERVAAVNNKLVFEIIGRERYLSLSEQELMQVGTALTWKNDFAVCAAQEIQRSDKWKSRTLDGVQHSYRATVGAGDLHQGDLLSTVAHMLNESRSVIEDRYKSALDILEPEIKALAPYLTQMRRYVSAPGKMLRDSVESGREPKSPTRDPYPTQPREFIAKFTGRPASLWKIGRASIGSSSDGHALSKAQVAHLNAQWSEMLREAGISQRAAGPRLGSPLEMTADTIFRVATDAAHMTVGAAKQTVDSAKRLSASVIASMSPRKYRVDRQKKPGM
jgi:hypothetical protein